MAGGDEVAAMVNSQRRLSDGANVEFPGALWVEFSGLTGLFD